MAKETLSNITDISREAVPAEKLDEMLWQVYSGSVERAAVLKRFVRGESKESVPAAAIRHLRIIGDGNGEYLRRFTEAGFREGIYVSADDSWMMVIRRGNSADYLTQFQQYPESMWILNSQAPALKFEKISALTELLLADHGQLRQLSIVECPKLTGISFRGEFGCLSVASVGGCAELASLQGLENLTQLIHLNLRGCHSLTRMSGLEKLRRLNNLILRECLALRELPPLDDLRQLSYLDLSRCRFLRTLPDMKNLSRLVYLDLSGCIDLTGLPDMDSLERLNKLILSGCRGLTALPETQKLTRLTTLSLFGCTGIRTLPEGLRYWESLRLLDLSEMRLRDLPNWLPEIAQQFTVVHRMEPGRNKAVVVLCQTTVHAIQDMSIFEQPYKMVAKWFRERSLGNTQLLNEIKVVFLGDGEAGKSHTIARLMNDGGAPDHAVFDGQSTPGIVIRNKEYQLDGRSVRVHYWDFGGQEIMHSMHRIFLTGRTMYVILLNARDDTQGDRAKYWLHNVKSFAPDAPVLLVLNKIDQNENASVDEVDLRGRYSKLTRVVRLSALKYSQAEFNQCLTRVLLEEIRKTGYLDAEWPAAWTRVKEKLENMKTHYIMGDDYQMICRECQVNEHQKDLLHWFNDLGVSFCFCDDEDYTLEDYVILRPDWITNALYIILFNKVKGAGNGLIPHKSIYNILKDAHRNPDIRCTLPNARYTAGDIGYVLGIMRKFNLSFTDGDHNEFIPMLCQQNSTVDVQYYCRDEDTLEFNMVFDYLPNNLLHRLMVERNKELDRANVWRTGARFRFEELGFSAVVVIDGNTLRFFVQHADSMHRPNTYLTMLKTHVERIVVQMGLKAPAGYLVYKWNGTSVKFRYDRLLKMRQKGHKEEYCEELDADLLIENILNQSAPAGMEDEEELLNAIVRSCRHIQDEPNYRLVKNKDGTGDANGKGMEDLRNRRIRDDLTMNGYRVCDQSQRGASSTGKSVGEPDLLVLAEDNEPWTMIEALRVSDGTKSDWNKHLDKLIGSYNSRGMPLLYLLTYVDADPPGFAKIWEGYQFHIKGYHPGHYSYCEGSFTDMSEGIHLLNAKAARCQYHCGGMPVTVYHIFARIPPRNE